MKNRKLNILLLSSLFFGCASYDKRDFKNLQVEPAISRLGTAIFYQPECPFITSTKTQEVSVIPLVTPLISIGSSLIVNTIGKAIEQHQQGLNGQFIANGVFNREMLNDGSCLVVVRGLFGSSSSVPNTNSNHLTGKLLANLHLIDYPTFYMEVKINSKPKALELQPVYLSYAATSARTIGSGKKYVSVVIAINDTSPKPKGDLFEEKSIAVFRHDFGQLTIGKSYQNETLIGTSASQQQKSEQPIPQDLFNISALVTESEEPTIAQKALLEAFNSKKDALEAGLEASIKRALGIKDQQK